MSGPLFSVIPIERDERERKRKSDEAKLLLKVWNLLFAAGKLRKLPEDPITGRFPRISRF